MTAASANDPIGPLFVSNLDSDNTEIATMPGVVRFGVASADGIATYFARKAAQWLNEAS